MEILKSVMIMGVWEIAIQTKNAQEQQILMDKLNSLGIKFDTSGESEVLVYANDSQKTEVDKIIANIHL